MSSYFVDFTNKKKVCMILFNLLKKESFDGNKSVDFVSKLKKHYGSSRLAKRNYSKVVYLYLLT